MNSETFITVLSYVLGGGTMGAVGAFFMHYFKFKAKSKALEISASSRIISQWEKLLAPLQDKIQILENKLEDYRLRELRNLAKVTTLENQLILFESSHIDIPLPVWMKDTEGKMLFLNKRYEDMFLTPMGLSMGDYIGNKDKAVWSLEVAKKFGVNDKIVIRTKKPLRVIEAVDDGAGNIFYVDSLKYPRTTANGKVIGISGIIMDSGLTKEELSR